MTASPPDHPLATDSALRRRLTALARRWVGEGEAARDLVQDTFLRTPVEGLPPGEVGRQAWLTTVLRHLCIDWLRRRGRHEALMVLAGMPGEAASAEQEVERAQQVDAALTHLARHLAPEDAAAVLLHEVFEVGHAELGAMVGRSEAASRQHLHRAMRRLRATREGAPRQAGEPADGDDAAVLALCRQALVERDATGLVALLRGELPLALRSATAGAPSTHRAGRSHARVVVAQGRLALAVCLGDQVVCVLPLGCRDAAPVAQAG